MEILTDERLQSLSTSRLLRLLDASRAKASNIWHHAGSRCCEICNEFIGTDEEWKKEVVEPAQKYEKYKERIKAVLSTRRQNHPESKRKKQNPVKRAKGR